jgi:hypothetical protein
MGRFFCVARQTNWWTVSIRTCTVTLHEHWKYEALKQSLMISWKKASHSTHVKNILEHPLAAVRGIFSCVPVEDQCLCFRTQTYL